MTPIHSHRAALLSLVLGLLCLGPSLLPGRSLLPRDPRAYSPLREDLDPVELAQVEAADRRAVPHRADKLLQFLPFDTAVGRSWRRGEVPLWEPGILCGIPLVGQTTSRAFYPTALAFAFLSPDRVYAWSYLLHLVIGGTCLYRLARRLGASEPGGLLGTASFVLSGYALGHLHHPMIFMAAVWTLPALEATHALLRPRGGGPKGPLLALAAATALSWLAGFPQASVLLVYLVAGLAVCLVVEDWRGGRGLRLRGAVQAAVGLGLGLGLAMVQVLPAVEASAGSSREPATVPGLEARALAPAHLLDLVLPGQMAAPGDITPVDPNEPRPTFLALWLVSESKSEALATGVHNHTETAIGFGVWPLVLALASLLDLARGRRREHRAVLLFLWSFSLLGLLAALATPGLVQVALLLPGFAVGDFKRLLMLPAVCLPLCAALGWRDWNPRMLARAALPGVASLALGLVVLRASPDAFARFMAERIAPRADLAPEVFLGVLLPDEAAANQALLGGGLLALGLALALAPLVRRLVPASLAHGGAWTLIALTAVELLPVAAALSPAPPSGTLDTRPALLADTGSGSDARLLRLEPAPGRNLADIRLLPPNLPSVLGMQDAMGYAPLPPARIERLFEALEPGSTTRGSGLGCLRDPASATSPLVELTGARYLLTTHAGELDGWRTRGTPVADGETRLLERETPVEPARLYWSARELDATGLPGALAAGLDPRVEVALETAHLQELPGAGSGSARVTASDARSVTVAVETDAETVLVLAEAWFPGWTYRVDGGPERDCFPANVTFRAALVPPGAREVVFRYAPRAFRTGRTASLLALALCLGLLLVPGRWLTDPVPRG